jgi:mono/diheme cytochrome c family protein
MKKILVCHLVGLFIPAILLMANQALGDAEAGKAIYESRCQMCHGPNGDGKGPVGLSLKPRPEDFTNPNFWQQDNIAQLITETVTKGKGPMPAMGLTPDEIQSVMDYMSQTFKK